MASEKKIESQTINIEQASSSEKSPESSFDSTKIEQILQAQVQKKSDLDTNQVITKVKIPDDQSQARPISSELILEQVENILSKDMDNIFLTLDAGTQRVFKLKGEETSKKVTNLLLQSKIKVKEITMLILEWLRIIPQVNKHYLEQEAKIKTDNILEINKQK